MGPMVSPFSASQAASQAASQSVSQQAEIKNGVHSIFMKLSMKLQCLKKKFQSWIFFGKSLKIPLNRVFWSCLNDSVKTTCLGKIWLSSHIENALG